MSTANFNVSSDLRLGAIGRTGSGKTFLMERMLASQPRDLVVDSKHRVKWPGYYLTDDPTAAMLRDKVIYRPPEGKTPPAWFWTAAMDSLHERGGGIIYLDEAGEVTTPNMIPSGLRTVVRLGREIGVGVWWSSQEATSVSNVLIRQSDILCLFMNHGASDRDKLIQTCGDMGEVPGVLGFYEFTIYQANGAAYDSQNINVYKAPASRQEALQPQHP